MNRVSKLLIATLSVAAGSLWLNMAHAASFDCAKARTKVERMNAILIKRFKRLLIQTKQIFEVSGAADFIERPVAQDMAGLMGFNGISALTGSELLIDKTLGRMHQSSREHSNRNRQDRRWVPGVTLASACVGVMFALSLTPACAKPVHPAAHDDILGRYTVSPVNLGFNAGGYFPLYPECRALAANLNQFRDVPFDSKNPRLSPKYPQFRRPHWTPMAWNRKLAQRVGGMGPCLANDPSCEPAWHWWLKKTKPLREAGKTLLWRTTVDLLGNGQHETIIRLDHILPYNIVRGRFVPPAAIPPYSPYLDDKLYMLPSPNPQLAEVFNVLFSWGWQIGSKQGNFPWPTDLIKNTHDKNYPYYVLTWLRTGHRRDGVIGVGVITFPGATSYPLCTIKWIAKGGSHAQ